MNKAPRDVELIYSTPEVVAKLRRLADALESGKPFRVQVAGERIRVPRRAQFSVEHERGADEEEIEFPAHVGVVGPAAGGRVRR
jgi:amphi-Trp domain-containing protein